MSDDPIILTADQALSMLPDGDRIHTFRSAGIALVGCDWDRDKIEEAIRENECELGGPMCQKMNHGLAVHVGGDPLFVECKPEFDYAQFEVAVSST